MHWVARHGDCQSAEVLVRAGCPAFLPDRSGSFPLDVAGLLGYSQIVKLLVAEYLENRKTLPHLLADSERRKKFDKIQLACLQSEYLRLKVAFWALMYPESGFTNELLMVSDNEDSNCCRLTFPLPSLGGMSVLHAAACYSTEQPLTTIETKLNMLKKRNDPTPLITLPSESIQPGWVEELAGELKSHLGSKEEYRVHWNVEDFEGNTPLHMAVKYRRKNCIKYLLSQGGNPFSENQMLLTPPQCSYDSEVSKIFRDYFSQLRGTTALNKGSLTCCSRKKVYSETGNTNSLQLFAAESQAFAHLCVVVEQTKAKPTHDRLASADRFDWVIRFFIERGYQVSLVSTTTQGGLMALVRVPPSLLLRSSSDYAQAPAHRKAQEKISQDISLMLDFPALKREGTISTAFWLFNYTALRRLENAASGGIMCLLQYPNFRVSTDDSITRIFEEIFGPEMTAILKSHRWLLSRSLVACLLAILPQIFLFSGNSAGHPAVIIPCAVVPFIFLVPPVTRLHQINQLSWKVPLLALGLLIVQGGMWVLYNFLLNVVVSNPTARLDGFLRGLYGGVIIYLLKFAGDLSIESFIGVDTRSKPNLFSESDPTRLLVSKLCVSVPNTLLYFLYLVMATPLSERQVDETTNRDLLTYFVYGFLLTFVVARSVVILVLGFLQPLLIKSTLFKSVKASYNYQEPRVEKNDQTRRAVISLPQHVGEPGDAWSPLPDFAELDALRFHWDDPSSFLQASVLQVLFCVVSFFVVPGAIWVVTVAIFVEIFSFFKLALNRASLPAIDHIPFLEKSHCMQCNHVDILPRWLVCVAWFSSASFYMFWSPAGFVELSRWHENGTQVYLLISVAVLLLITIFMSTFYYQRRLVSKTAQQNMPKDNPVTVPDDQTQKDEEPSVDHQPLELGVPRHQLESVQAELRNTLEANRELHSRLERLVHLNKEHWFNPGHLKTQLMFTAYRYIHNSLLSMRSRILAQVVRRPLCQELPCEAATVYFPKLDAFVSEHALTDFAVKMDAEQLEMVSIPQAAQEQEEGMLAVKKADTLDLGDYLLIMQDQEWGPKFELYKAKDKLTELIEEYRRKKGEEYIREQKKSLVYWIKPQKSNLSPTVGETLFEQFKKMYNSFIGFNQEVADNETSVSKVLNLQVSIA